MKKTFRMRHIISSLLCINILLTGCGSSQQEKKIQLPKDNKKNVEVVSETDEIFEIKNIYQHSVQGNHFRTSNAYGYYSDDTYMYIMTKDFDNKKLILEKMDYVYGFYEEYGSMELEDIELIRSLQTEQATSFKLSPDGRNLAYVVENEVSKELWLYDLVLGEHEEIFYVQMNNNFNSDPNLLDFKWDTDGQNLIYWYTTYDEWVWTEFVKYEISTKNIQYMWTHEYYDYEEAFRTFSIHFSKDLDKIVLWQYMPEEIDSEVIDLDKRINSEDYYPESTGGFLYVIDLQTGEAQVKYQMGYIEEIVYINDTEIWGMESSGLIFCCKYKRDYDIDTQFLDQNSVKYYVCNNFNTVISLENTNTGTDVVTYEMDGGSLKNRKLIYKSNDLIFDMKVRDDEQSIMLLSNIETIKSTSERIDITILEF